MNCPFLISADLKFGRELCIQVAVFVSFNSARSGMYVGTVSLFLSKSRI